MARPLKTGMDYFPHDTDASNDEKVELLRALYGNDGYVFYFIMLERIYRTSIGELNISEAETKQNEFIFDEEIISILSKKIAVSNEIFHKILQTSFKHNIFCKKTFLKKGVVTSSGIKKRMEPILKKRSNMLKKYNNIVKVSDAETKQKKDRNTAETDIEKERKEKERRVKKSKEENNIKNKNLSRKILYKLNELTGKKFQLTEKNLGFIIARLNENKNLTIEDFKKVIQVKMKDSYFLKNNGKFLRPETLFGNKFDGYLNECIGSIQPQSEGMKKDGFTDEYYKNNSPAGNLKNLLPK